MKRLLTVLMVLSLGLVQAHAHLSESEPANGDVLAMAPEQVTLRFSEPLETMFSIFKVYRLDAEVDLSADNAGQRLNGLAAALVNDVLELREDGPGRVDTGMESDGATTSELSIILEGDLPAGHYVAMWRALSIDTHTTEGYIVFSVAD